MIVATGKRNSGHEPKKPKADTKNLAVSGPLPVAGPSANKPLSVASLEMINF